MPTDDQIKQLEQRHAALDEALDREITFLRKQEAAIPTTPMGERAAYAACQCGDRNHFAPAC